MNIKCRCVITSGLNTILPSVCMEQATQEDGFCDECREDHQDIQFDYSRFQVKESSNV